MRKIYQTLAICSLLALVGCSYNHPNPKMIKDEINNAIVNNTENSLDIPEDVINELNSGAPLSSDGTPFTLKRFSIAANEVPAVEFFSQVVDQTGNSIVVHPEVAGLISLTVDNVTLDEVFDSLYNVYGYKIERKGDVFYVYPAGVHTEIIPINYLAMIRNSETKLSITSSTISSEEGEDSGSNSSSSSSSNSDSSDSENDDSGSKVETTSVSDFWKELEETLSGIVGDKDGRFVRISPQTSSVSIRAMPDEIKAVKDYLQLAENSLKRQVIIEAKLLEVTLDEGYEQGINWGMVLNGSNSSLKINENAAVKGFTSSVFSLLGGGLSMSGSYTHNDDTYNTFISLLKVQGDVATLSSPRITTVNNQRAIMKIGTDEYYVTGVETLLSSNSSSSSSDVVSNSATIKPFFSGVSLDVLPQISDNGTVIMHIHPAVVDVEESVKDIQFSDTQTMKLPTARSSVRETDTIVEAKSGDIIVIGGLMTRVKVDRQSKVPVIGDIPLLGELFTNKIVEDRKAELVILLRPVVVGGETWKDEMQKAADLLQKWYPDDSLSLHDRISNKED
jgi:MSHA biogenesis protein MshL